MRYPGLLLLLLVLPPVTPATADDHLFTQLEQQQISIATQGLFDRSLAFTIDFSHLKEGSYSFPLPIGKARQLKDNYVEISTKKGDAVKAMFDGVVRVAKKHSTQGNVIVVRHANGLETVYAHNAQNLVEVGSRVKSGQTIAIVGGEAGHTFCLFSVMVNGNRINPATLFIISNHRLYRQTLMFRKKESGNVEVTVVRGDKESSPRESMLADFDPRVSPFAHQSSFTIKFNELSDDEWAYPLPNAKVISYYGRRGGRSHTGVDLKTRANDNIYAVFDGVVTMSQHYSGYGKCIKIKHVNGLETLYSHNSKNLVNVGDRVRAGQLIALTGRTGRATTEHLHFECRVGGVIIDPTKLFDHQRHELRKKPLTFTKQGGRVVVR